MLSGEGNENGEKTTIGLISKKATLHVQHTFCTFLCRCFARLQRKTSRNFLVTRFMEEVLYVFLFTFFFTVAHFHPGGRQHPAATKFHVVRPTKNVSLYFLSLALAPFLVELCWPVALPSLFLCLNTEKFSAFRFRLY